MPVIRCYALMSYLISVTGIRCLSTQLFQKQILQFRAEWKKRSWAKELVPCLPAREKRHEMREIALLLLSPISQRWPSLTLQFDLWTCASEVLLGFGQCLQKSTAESHSRASLPSGLWTELKSSGTQALEMRRAWCWAASCLSGRSR